MKNAKVISIDKFTRTSRTQKRQAAPGRSAESKQREALSLILDDLTEACVMDVSQRTGVSATEIVQHLVREWWEMGAEQTTASFLRRQIRASKRDAKKWGA